MNTLIVLAHPERASFNGAMADRAAVALRRRGFEVRITDLYRENFDPVAGPADFAVLRSPGFFRLQGEQFECSKAGGFAPDIERELEKLFWCDLLILQFPTWWFAAPAILKGWIDRVMVAGRVYDGWAGKLYDQGGLRGRRALISTTVGGVQSMYQPDGLNGVSIADCHRSLLYGVLNFVGFTVLEPHVVFSPARLDDASRSAALGAYEARLQRVDSETPMSFPRLADFDENFVRRV